MDKFDPNPVLVYINKLKPYKLINDQTLQPILVKLNDFLSKNLVDVKFFDNLFNQQ
jgi:hypothetical protein